MASGTENIRVFLAGFFLFLALLTIFTSRIREMRLRELEKKVVELGRRLETFTFVDVANELKIKEYDAKILLRKLATRGRIKVKKERGEEEYYL